MISPYVRRWRLAAEIHRLREDHGYSAERLAKAIGVARQRISRLENGHIRPDLSEIMKILEEFRVGAKRWDQLMTIARDARERGWWEQFAVAMGRRQALYANLEAGATTIREYHHSFVPSLVQTREFTLARLEVDKTLGPLAFDPDRALEGRRGRQRLLRRPGGPAYELIVDELVVRRLPVPPHVMAGQLQALVESSSTANITIRVLPVDALIAGYRLPRSAYSLYTYLDPGDPAVVAVDTVTMDHVMLGAAETAPYIDLFDRLRDAALPIQDSRELMAQVAEDLAGRQVPA